MPSHTQQRQGLLQYRSQGAQSQNEVHKPPCRFKALPNPSILRQHLTDGVHNLCRSTALAIVAIQPIASSASGDGGSPNYRFQLALKQWVELQHPPSTNALTFCGAGGTTLFVGAVGEEAPAVFSQRNGAFLPETC